ncbi:MAG: DUF1512 domain-containing protein [Candidatus Aenigmarchaeota archaeon]|nr:DUF1512 domain-containing protein [Candidatus Aenigmarchaeota archaeon]
MDSVNFQLGGGDWFSTIIFMLFWVVFLFFYPRLMVSQIMWKLERTARELEDMSEKSKKFIIREITKKQKPTKELKESINRFYEFFVIGPVSLDPYGVVPKFDHVIRAEKDRFTYFVRQIAPHLDSEEKANIEMGLAGGITVHEISKIVRHYVELVRKTKNIQIAMLLQMQLPMIERIAKAMFKGTESLSKGEPIGDGLGPLVVADMAGKATWKEIGEEEIIVTDTKANGRNLILVKAKGPGGRIGFPGKVVAKLVREKKIARIITIDAAAKLEGEKTGSLAEGVGVAMGGPGTERFFIEEIIVKKNIPVDSIVVKMSQEEAITPMRKVIKDSMPEVRKSINRSLEMTKSGDTVIIVGVGNTSGVGNSSKDAESVKAWIEKYERDLKAKRKDRKKKNKNHEDFEME